MTEDDFLKLINICPKFHSKYTINGTDLNIFPLTSDMLPLSNIVLEAIDNNKVISQCHKPKKIN